MALTLSEKVLNAHCLDKRQFGQYFRVEVDLVLGHDATIALLINEFEKRALSVWDKSKVLFTNDHFSPPATIERAEISKKFLTFSHSLGIHHLLVDKGICHQLMVEHAQCSPGALIIGADSHTIMGGGLGACATGMGSTDILYALATGTTWMRSPETIKIVFKGDLPSHCSGRDVILMLLSIFKESGAQYCAFEFHDQTKSKIQQDDRFAIANMCVEMGAKFAVFIADDITLNYCQQRDGVIPSTLVKPDQHARYQSEIEINLSRLTPQIAIPYSPANVISLDQLAATEINIAFLGSCSSGRLRDIADAAAIVAGKTIHPKVRFIVIPASQQIYLQALEQGYIATLIKSGAMVNHASCGPCGGIDKGVLGPTDVCISTSNRNFRGRMGHWQSQTYLANARVVAEAALTGSVGSMTTQARKKITTDKTRTAFADTKII